MKRGFQIEIQKDLTTEIDAIARQQADKWIAFMKDGYNKSSGGGRTSCFRRGALGTIIPKSGLVFRRISKNRRVFAFVHYTTLQLLSGAKIDPDGYHYYCRGYGNVSSKHDKVIFDRPETYIYYTEGETKG